MINTACCHLLAAHEIFKPGKCRGLSWSLFNVAHSGIAKGCFRTSRPCELPETAYNASKRKLKKRCNPRTPLCMSTLTPTNTQARRGESQHTHRSRAHDSARLRAGLYEGLNPPDCPPCRPLWRSKFQTVGKNVLLVATCAPGGRPSRFLFPDMLTWQQNMAVCPALSHNYTAKTQNVCYLHINHICILHTEILDFYYEIINIEI